jgi:hypothetical protein
MKPSANKTLPIMKILRVAVLALLLASGILFSTHHHDLDGHSHNHCPVCFAWHVSASALPEEASAPETADVWADLTDCPFESPRRALSAAAFKSRAPPFPFS